MFEITVEESFAAGHLLRGYKGKCEKVHGHNYRVRVTLEGQRLDPMGLLYDFVELRRRLSQLAEAVDHKFLNDLPPFDQINPSAENIAKYFYEEISKQLAATPGQFGANDARVKEVTVFETDTTIATYRT